jgi:hypothetical protein
MPMLTALLAPLAAAECPTSALALSIQRIAEIKAAYTQVEVEAFDSSGTALVDLIPCVDDPFPPELVIELHYVLGLRAFANQDQMGAQRSLSAVRELAPEWKPNEGTLDKDSPVFRFYEMQLPTEVVPLAERPPGGWVVDGVPADSVPGHRAFLLQAIGKHDNVIYTGYHFSPSTLPDLDLPGRNVRRNAHIIGTSGAGLLLVGAVVTETAAAGMRHKATDPSVESTEALALVERGRALESVAVAVGVTGVAGGAVTWLVPW